MTFPEKTREKLLCDDLPNEIIKNFSNIRFNPHKKILIIQKNKDCQIVIDNIKKMYYDDDNIFIIKSSFYTIVFWENIQKWKIIKSV